MKYLPFLEFFPPLSRKAKNASSSLLFRCGCGTVCLVSFFPHQYSLPIQSLFSSHLVEERERFREKEREEREKFYA